MMGILNVVFALGLLAGGADQAPTPPPPPLYNLWVSAEVWYSNRPGGLSAGSARPLVVGTPVRRVTDSGRNNCGFRAGFTELNPAAAIGWQVDAIPIAITPEHAVVQLRWSREIELGKRTGKIPEPEEVTVLLRPGDELQLDTFKMPTVTDSCLNPVATLVVSLKAPEPVRERVVATKVWLVHRQPGGQEKIQQVDLRGNFDSELPFFFDEVKAGSSVLDVFGKIRPRSTPAGLISLEFSAERRLTSGSEYPDTRYIGSGDVVITMGPEGVTEYQIPLGTSKAWEAFAGHSLAVRVQSRRIR